MKVKLVALDAALATAFHEVCGDLEPVEVVQGSILETACDAVVSPANSFGFMDGGIDAVYVRHFGFELQQAVRRAIWDHAQGELVVGHALVVPTMNERIPHLIVAPTMRVPMRLPADTVNPYLAARAAFLAARAHRNIDTLALPGLGTGVGGVAPTNSTRQVRKAIEDVVLENYQMPGDWAEASERHQHLYGDCPRNLQ